MHGSCCNTTTRRTRKGARRRYYKRSTTTTKRAEILAAIRQRKQQGIQQQHMTTNDNNDNNGKTEDEDYNRRRVETPRRQGEDTTAETRLAIVERQERGRTTATGREKEKTTTCCRHYDYSSSLPLYSDYLPFTFHVYSIAVCCSATTGSFQLREVETGERLQLVYNYSCQAGNYYRSYYRTTLELYNNMTTTPVINVEETTATHPLQPCHHYVHQRLRLYRIEGCESYLVDNLVKANLYN